MHWGSLDFHFVRPIRWFVALFDKDVIPFELANVKSGNVSRGHRFLGTGDFTIESPAAYEETCKEHFLIVDPEVRKQMILEGLQKLADEKGGTIIMDDDLLEEVVYLVEYPTALCGEFDEDYLKLPEAAIITPMKDHQRYFPMRDKDGKLMNLFLTVRNGNDYHLETVQHGNERVLRARLDDAKFFFEEDKKHKLADYTEKLKKIVFQDGLGTLYDKAQRLEKITVFLNHKLDLGLDDAKLQRASLLAKADLATQMVMEFTELQGVMGKEYASSTAKMPAWPKPSTNSTSRVLPATSCRRPTWAKSWHCRQVRYHYGHVQPRLHPDGLAGPFALRRQTIGTLNILMDAGWNLNCHEVFAFVLNLLGVEGEDAAKVMGQLDDYFTLRLKNIFQDKGMDYHIIDCVLASDTLNAYEEARRAQALIDADIMGKTDLLQAFTRVSNMIKAPTIPTSIRTSLKRKKKRPSTAPARPCRSTCRRNTPSMTTKA